MALHASPSKRVAFVTETLRSAIRCIVSSIKLLRSTADLRFEVSKNPIVDCIRLLVDVRYVLIRLGVWIR